MEVGQQPLHHLKFIAGIDEDIRFAGTGHYFPGARLFLAGSLVVKTGREFQGAHRRCADGNDAPLFAQSAIDLFGGFSRNHVSLGVQLVLLDSFDTNRLECSQAHVQSDLGGLNTARSNFFNRTGCKVKSGGGRRNRSARLRVDRLVAFAVACGIRPVDIWWQRNVSDPIESCEKIFHRRESDPPFTEFAPGNYLSPQLIRIAEKQSFPDSNLAAGTNQAFPLIRLLRKLAGEEDFNAAAKKVARRRIAAANRLSLKPGTSPVQTRGKDPRVVKNQQVVRPQEAGELFELPVCPLAAQAVQTQ